MAPALPPSLDYWRGFFSGARASIFDIIDAAIRVAAADCPDGLRARRDTIAHCLFTVLPPAEEPEAAMVAVPGPSPTLPEGASSVPSLCSSDGAAVAHRHDSDDPVVTEVFCVKAALSSSEQMSEDELLELLGRLQQLKFTVDTIKATEIGKAIKHLKKHGSKQIRQLARSLIEGWHAIVNEWLTNEAAIVDHTPQLMDTSCLEQEEEGGLPSPPMDEAALFATLCSSIQLSETLKLIPRRWNNNIRQTKSPSTSSFLSASIMIQCKSLSRSSFLSASSMIQCKILSRSSFLSASSMFQCKILSRSSFLSASSMFQCKSLSRSSFLSANSMIQWRTGGLISLQ